MNKYDKDRVKFYRYVQIHPEATGTAGLNFAPYKVSSPRLHMLASHMGQKPAIIHGEPPLVYTTVERAYAERLHVIETPAKIIVREVISKYSSLTPYDQNPPLTLVIFERADTGEIDVLEIPQNYCNHQTFGFRYIRTAVMESIYPGQVIDEGVILAKPDTLNDDGDWCFGRNVRMGFLPSEPGIEDGLCISESTARNFAMYGYGTVEMSFGKNKIPLNTYGDDDNYIPFPSIGDIIKPSGIIMSGREFDPNLAPGNMTKKSLQNTNQTDESVYGIPGARVVGIRIIRGTNQSNNLPQEVDDYVGIFTNKDQAYHNSILKLHNNLKKQYQSEQYTDTNAWRWLVTDAMFALNKKTGIKKEAYRGVPLDDLQVIIQYEYIYIPNKGAKFTGRQGDKAVVTRIKPDHLMPRDARGNYLDAYMDDSSTSNRMNPVRLDEMAINSCMETALIEIREAYERDNNLDRAWAILREAMDFLSPLTVDAMDAIQSRDAMREDIEFMLLSREEIPPHYVPGIRVALPPDNPVDYLAALAALKKRFPPLKDYLWITNDDGTVVPTLEPTLTGFTYMIPLERQANKFSAASSPKRQHHGIPVKPSKRARLSAPINDSPTRDKGEDETRGGISIMGGNVMAESFDRSLNPYAHQQECRSIYAARNPARITNTVPRHDYQIDPTVARQKVIPITGGRVVEIRDHVLRCGGVVFTMGEDGDRV